MKRVLALALVTLTALAAWVGLVAWGLERGFGQAPIATPGDADALSRALRERIEAEPPGNLALVLVEDGKVHSRFFSSVGAPVDEQSLFQVASLSKWITAWGVMTLVEAGRVDLDAPVSRYLTRWSLPASEHDTDGVSVRRLLSHTAGLTDGLGFAGYPPDAELPTLEQALAKPRKMDVAQSSGEIRVGRAPGSGWQYSGGGYLILQLLIEEVSGEPFETYMQRVVLAPLGMRGSSFVFDAVDEAKLATSYTVEREPGTLYRFTASGAAGLYTCAADLERFVRAHLPDASGALPHDVLEPETLRAMRTPEAFALGRPLWGLGPLLYVARGDDDFVFGHDGLNEPAINTTTRIDPATRSAIIVLETGSILLASELGSHWVLWKTGRPDIIAVTRQAPRAALALGIGAIVILAIAGTTAWRLRRAVRIRS